MNKKPMSILALTIFAVSFVPKSHAGGGDVATGAVVGGAVGLGAGYLIGKDKGGDPIEKEEAKAMRAERKADERERRRKELEQLRKEREQRQAEREARERRESSDND